MRPEKMRVQQAMEELVDEVDRLLPKISLANAHAADHLARSVESGLFNLAEALSAWKPKVKLARYEITRRETNEARAILRRLVRQRVLTREEAGRAYNLCGAVPGMLASASIAVEKRI
jgi:four helix bundle protein